jgi:hypothetical protein
MKKPAANGKRIFFFKDHGVFKLRLAFNFLSGCRTIRKNNAPPDPVRVPAVHRIFP